MEIEKDLESSNRKLLVDPTDWCMCMGKGGFIDGGRRIEQSNGY